MHACVCERERGDDDGLSLYPCVRACVSLKDIKQNAAVPLGPVVRNCAAGILAIPAAQGSIFPQVTDSDIIKPLLTGQTISTAFRPSIDNRAYQTHTQLAKICPQSKPFTLEPNKHHYIPADPKEKNTHTRSSVNRERESKGMGISEEGDTLHRLKISDESSCSGSGHLSHAEICMNVSALHRCFSAAFALRPTFCGPGPEAIISMKTECGSRLMQRAVQWKQ
nr:uncharacterized protein LOC103911161 [Danio rerio]|eukprot:XP_017212047.1 uncharacterized protein LOC103911161 [Danio rerio]